MGTDSTPPIPRSERTRPGLPPHRWTKVDDPGEVAVVASHATVIAGAGPAGLTAAYELTRHGASCVVLEAEPTLVGGISRTDQYKGYRFDIGGHRFFSKSEEVNGLWREILGDQLVTRKRLSRIYYNRKFFHYPLKPVDAFAKLGPIRTARILAQLRPVRRLKPIQPERSFEDWTVNRFGRVLFEMFFKTYTEKVWGMPTKEISADWAAQRIKGLNLTKTVLGRPLRQEGQGQGGGHQDPDRHLPVSPARPRPDVGSRPGEGPRGGQRRPPRRAGSPGSSTTGRWSPRSSPATPKASSPATRAALPLDPADPRADPGHGPPRAPGGPRAAESLRYRDFLTVVLILDRPDTFPDNWIYIHEPDVKVGRIQNFKNWSPDLVPDPSKSSLGLEYFCFEGDDLWTMTDADLIALGRREIDSIGLARPPRSSTAASSGCPRPIRSTTTPTRTTSR